MNPRRRRSNSPPVSSDDHHSSYYASTLMNIRLCVELEIADEKVFRLMEWKKKPSSLRLREGYTHTQTHVTQSRGARATQREGHHIVSARRCLLFSLSFPS